MTNRGGASPLPKGEPVETVFENRLIANYATMSEFYRKLGRNKGATIIIVICDVVMFVLFLYCCAWNILADMVFYFVLIAVVSAIMLFMPDWISWNILRNAKKNNDGVLPETVVTFGETIELHEGMVHLTIEYRKIQRIVHLKNSYVLMNGKRTGIILDPNGFTKGTFSEFKQFLRTKRPDLKIPE
jgi:hypothetical protein